MTERSAGITCQAVHTPCLQLALTPGRNLAAQISPRQQQTPLQLIIICRLLIAVQHFVSRLLSVCCFIELTVTKLLTSLAHSLLVWYRIQFSILAQLASCSYIAATVSNCQLLVFADFIRLSLTYLYLYWAREQTLLPVSTQATMHSTPWLHN